MPLYAIARLYVVEARNALEAFEGFDEHVRREAEGIGDPRVEYQSNCFPVTPEQAEAADWSIPSITYGNRWIESIPADEEEDR